MDRGMEESTVHKLLQPVFLAYPVSSLCGQLFAILRFMCRGTRFLQQLL